VQTDAERDRILTEQLPQVRYIARRIHERLPRHVPFEDLVHAGVVGLIDALNKFDLSKQVQFSSYAKFRIRGAILDSLRELDWSPRELRRKGRLVDSAFAELSGKLGRAPTNMSSPGRWGSACVNCKRCSRARRSRSRQPARRVAARRQRGEPHRLHSRETRGDAVFSVPALGDEAIAGAGSFELPERNSVCWRSTTTKNSP